MFMDNKHLAKLVAEASDDKKAKDILLINVEEVTTITDWIVISTGMSSVQVKAIAKSVEDKLNAEVNLSPLRKEGINDGNWALLDYGFLIVHVLQPTERKYYELEAFWSHGKITRYESN